MRAWSDDQEPPIKAKKTKKATQGAEGSGAAGIEEFGFFSLEEFVSCVVFS